MTITTHMDAYEHIKNFERAYLGPGVYVLYQGPVADKNIVYIGKSTADILMRVSSHQQTKDFDRVGVILPATTSEVHIHNLEHFVVEEFYDRFGCLPEFNRQRPRFHEDGRSYNWHQMGRRRVRSIFVGDEPPRSSSSSSSAAQRALATVGDVKELVANLARRHPDATRDELWTKAARAAGRQYTANTLRHYCSTGGLHGNTILRRLTA